MSTNTPMNKSVNAEDNTYDDARAQFHRQAVEYASSIPHARSDSLKIVEKWASQRRHHKALDIATGPGFTAFAIAPFCNLVTASDIAPGMLQQAQKLAQQRRINNINFQNIDAHNIPYPDNTMDLITCRTAPHHFKNIPQFLSEVHRTLKPGGTFILVDTTTSENETLAQWHQTVEGLRDSTHINAPSPSQWHHLITNSQLHITETAHTQVNMTFQDWVKRSGTPPNKIDILLKYFTSASPEVVKEYTIKPIDKTLDDFTFSWPVIAFKAEKTATG